VNVKHAAADARLKTMNLLHRAMWTVGHPTAQTRLGDPEIPRDLADRLLTQPSELGRTLTELRLLCV
jgi:hypothetical protein